MSELSTLGNILLFTFIGSVGALIGGMLLLVKKKFAIRISHFLASFAAGTLLGAAFLDLLPEAAHEVEEAVEKGGGETNIFLWSLLGIVIFFLLERIIHWFHHHEEYLSHKEEVKSTVPLIIIGDTMHNFLDGVVIALTFLANAPLGIVTTLAVFAHEVPQEIGDFGLLLHKGMSRKKVIAINILSACAAFAGALLAYRWGEAFESSIPIFLSITAGFFIYIASSDIIPEIHYEKRKRHAIFESLLLVLGIVVIWVAVSFLEPRTSHL